MPLDPTKGGPAVRDDDPTNPAAPPTRFALGADPASERVQLAERDGAPVIILRAGPVTVDASLVDLLNQLLGVDWHGVATAD